MTEDGARPYQFGDADRENAAEAAAFFERLRASKPAEITNADRDADKAEIAKLKADLSLTQRAVVSHGKEIRRLKADLTAVRSAVIELQQQPRTTGRPPAPARKRDGLDQALERELYD